MQLVIALGVLSLLTGCQEEELGLRLSPERGAVHFGSEDFDEEGTVMLAARSGTGCSGSMITPTVVLTANHCVEGTVAEEWVIMSGHAPRPVTPHRIIEIVTPGPFTEDSEDDLALMIVDRPVPLPTYVAAWQIGDDILGEEVDVVGYGLDEEGNSGRRLRGEMYVTDLEYYYMRLEGGQWPGSGDSGGPIFGPDHQVIAVTSRGGPNVGIVTRVDHMRWLMDDILRAEGGCVPGDRERCDRIDNNCDSVIDEGCTLPGGTCEDASVCTTGYCEEVESERVCTQPCDPADPESCWGGGYCQERGCGEGWCRAGDPGDTELGERCDDDLDCASMMCRDPGDGERRCTSRCEPDHLDCAPGQLCARLTGECGGCFPIDVAVWPRGLGEPCEADDECREGVCLEEESRAFCSRSCGDNGGHCPETMYCRGGLCSLGQRGELGHLCETDDDCANDLFCWESDSGDGVCTEPCGPSRTWCQLGASCDFDREVCVPAGRPLGANCDLADSSSCAQGACVELEAGPVCTTSCHPMCPAGFRCRELEGDRWCVRAPTSDGDRGGCGCSAGGARGTMPRITQLFRL